MSNNKSAKDEDDVFEFLNSLPESDKNGDSTGATKASKPDAKTDEDILDFLNELEANDKKKPAATTTSSTKKKTADKNTNKTETKPATEEINFNEKPTTATTSESATQQDDSEAGENVPVNDPITSFSNWWSKEGSARVSSQMNSFWGTAQSIRQTAKEKAEEAIKIAKENSLEDNLKNAFKEVGITGVLEGDRELTEEEKKELLKLPDVAKTFDSLNKGFGIFQNRLATVIDKIQQDLVVSAPRDEILDIKFVHDLKNYPSLVRYVKNNFELVMRAQVDGEIDVIIEETGTASITENSKDLGLFTGKILDGEKLIQANIDSIIRETEKKEKEKEANESKENSETEVTKGSPDARKSSLYIGLLASTIQTSTAPNDEDSTITIDSYSPNSFTFTTILVDTTHDITIINRSQPFPLKWAKWLDGSKDEEDKEKKSKKEGETEEGESVGEESSDDYEVDPSEWVNSWIDRGLDMTFGVLAQSYIIKRMGY